MSSSSAISRSEPRQRGNHGVVHGVHELHIGAGDILERQHCDTVEATRFAPHATQHPAEPEYHDQHGGSPTYAHTTGA
jgi:hypothetical protein